MPRDIKRYKFLGEMLTAREIAERTGTNSRFVYSMTRKRGDDAFANGADGLATYRKRRFTAEEAADLRRQWAQPELAK